MAQRDCPFCRLETNRIRLVSEFCMAFPDEFPIAEGHTLVIPKRHVASLFELSDEEQAAVWKLVSKVRALLLSDLQPDGFNVGLNDGASAGQTVMHAHVHVIPRRRGDVADPKGGVRWVIPERAAYWTGDQK
jgi:diadenosine tetraphosphate (Ap4A) HIT family hydrolase